MPAGEHESHLRAVLSYYCSVVNVTPEGDSMVSEETLEGLGRGDSSSISSQCHSLLCSLFGSLLRLAFAPTSPPSQPAPQDKQATDGKRAELRAQTQDVDAVQSTLNTLVDAPTIRRRRLAADDSNRHNGDGTPVEHLEPSQPSGQVIATKKKPRLTDLVPDPGYFLAGAIAGGVSRTATAPLDRLKVYLLVKTSGSSESAAAAIKQGQSVAAVKNAVRPCGDAVKYLYQSGGVRGFFAGKEATPGSVLLRNACEADDSKAALRRPQAMASTSSRLCPRRPSSSGHTRPQNEHWPTLRATATRDESAPIPSSPQAVSPA